MTNVLADRCVLPRLQGQYSWTVIFLSSTSEGHVAGCDSPPVLLVLRTMYGADKSKGGQPLFTPHLISAKMIIGQVCIYGGLITTPQSMLLLGQGCL